MTSKSNNTELTMLLNSGIASLSSSVIKKGYRKTSPLPTYLNKMIVFNTRRQQTKETYHIIFDESPDAIKFSKPSVDNINIVENERYLTKEYLYPYELSQRDGILTRAMAKELSVASAHECLFVDFLSEEDPKKVFEALRHPRWVDAMQDELNQFSRNKVWTLVLELCENSNGTPPNNLGPDLSGKAVNETQYRARYQAKSKEIPTLIVSTENFQLTLTMLDETWGRKKHSAEAEYVATAGCCANILWMKSQLTDYDIIYEKHIDIRYHFIRDHILKGDIELHFIPTQYQLADIFTKPLDEPTFKRLIVELDLHEHLGFCRLRWKIDDDENYNNQFSIT
ncbi:hypothetical protein Tco_1006518 [Tanacetum coccineum]|uniref:Reverse transcriptase Ty1/copia-type domain-containing protein n=1 Tax=Tanacetum coccineum TaxID=301880 RepID=A0ABQ5FJ68_9ASTR